MHCNGTASTTLVFLCYKVDMLVYYKIEFDLTMPMCTKFVFEHNDGNLFVHLHPDHYRCLLITHHAIHWSQVLVVKHEIGTNFTVLRGTQEECSRPLGIARLPFQTQLPFYYFLNNLVIGWKLISNETNNTQHSEKAQCSI